MSRLHRARARVARALEAGGIGPSVEARARPDRSRRE
jgi:hypothetical protein